MGSLTWKHNEVHTPKQPNQFSPQGNNIKLIKRNIEQRQKAVKDLKQHTFYDKWVVPVPLCPVKNQCKNNVNLKLILKRLTEVFFNAGD